MSVSVTLANTTTTDVYFGLYNGENANDESDKVDAGESKTVTINANARIVGVWIDEDTFYPNNDNPFVIGYYFASGHSYTVTLTTSGLSVSVS